MPVYQAKEALTLRHGYLQYSLLNGQLVNINDNDPKLVKFCESHK